MYTPREARMGGYTPPYVHRGIYTRVYHPWYTLLGTPPYTTVHGPSVLWVLPPCPLPGREALGSSLRFSLGMRRIELSFSLGCEEECVLLRRITPAFQE